MAKARTKKRRAGRIGKVKLKTHAYAKFKPTNISDAKVRAKWDPRKSPAANMASMGLRPRPNEDGGSTAAGVRRRGLPVDPLVAPSGVGLGGLGKAGSAEGKGAVSNPVELFDVPESDVIPAKTKALRMLPVSVEDQEYLAKCMGKHGTDYGKMFRDTKVNNMQHTEGKLKKMCARFLLLTPDQLRVEVPEKVQHLMVRP
uniref:Nucleolar protein 16 n=1 Tax=Trieres chinensis TaxID=1514140 RepID=A0A7S1ZIL3_TRICV|mmetsp:Transcript_26427/g.54112  ORF Transcript_26427/g.54112 Transcript_26427/m.54112 type:complete len:200 (+) Transcript_26427:126-725(+)